MRLEGKVAIVTGAGQGIGAATARRMAEEGASVVVSDVAEENATAVVGEIEAAGGKATFVRCDVSDVDEVKSLMDAAVAAFGKLDILHNNAGVHETAFTTSAQSHELPEEIWDKVIAINLRGPWLCSKYAAPLLKEAGGGVIVNAASIGGLVGYPMGAAYGPSKAGLIQLTRVMAIELAPQGTRVVCYAPGNTDTPMVQKYYNQPGMSDEERADGAGAAARDAPGAAARPPRGGGGSRRLPRQRRGRHDQRQLHRDRRRHHGLARHPRRVSSGLRGRAVPPVRPRSTPTYPAGGLASGNNSNVRSAVSSIEESSISKTLPSRS